MAARVLIVDDNATNRFILTEMLHNWRMAPFAAASGRICERASRRRIRKSVTARRQG